LAQAVQVFSPEMFEMFIIFLTLDYMIVVLYFI